MNTECVEGAVEQWSYIVDICDGEGDDSSAREPVRVRVVCLHGDDVHFLLLTVQ